MIQAWLIIAWLVLGFATALYPQTPVVRVLETDPPTESFLPPGARFSLRLSYESSQRLYITAYPGYGDPLGLGVEGSFGSGGKSLGPGSGETVVWFTVPEGQRVTEAVILASGSKDGPSLRITIPCALEWKSGVRPRVEPEWARYDWAAHRDAFSRHQSAANTSAKIGSPQFMEGLPYLIAGLINLCELLSIPVYFLLQVLSIWVLGLRLRKFALVPMLGVVPALTMGLFSLVRMRDLQAAQAAMFTVLPLLCSFSILYLGGLLLWQRANNPKA